MISGAKWLRCKPLLSNVVLWEAHEGMDEFLQELIQISQPLPEHGRRGEILPINVLLHS
jgi:hypothetical protein